MNNMRLQWTHRLRDYLAKEKYFIEVSAAGSLCAMKEVELIQQPIVGMERASGHVESMGGGSETAPSATRKRKAPAKSKRGPKVLNNSTPKDHDHARIEPFVACTNPPSFEQFSDCYQEQEGHLLLKTSATKSDILASFVARHDFCAAHAGTSFDALCQEGTQFSVFWLSDTVFMSSLFFCMRGGREVPDYGITLVPRHGKKAVQFFVYSILSFAKGRQRRKPVPSVTPITFIASLASRLPADYFEDIHFTWHRDDCPQPALEFLSIVPSQHPPTIWSNTWDPLTTVRFHSQLSPHLIGAVLAYCEANRLSVRHSFGILLDEGVNRALLDSPCLQHVHIPPFYFLHSSADEVPFTENGRIESMSVHFYNVRESSLLRSASRSRSLKRLYLEVPSHELEVFRSRHSCLLNDVLSGVSNLQEIKIFFEDTKRAELDSLFQSLDMNCVTARTKLCHFSITTGPWNRKGRCFAVRDGIVSGDLWDKVVSPRLAINWYSEHNRGLPKYAASGKEAIMEGSQQNLVSWKVRAVNLGIVYRKTTCQVPHDMRTANACMLFALVRYGN
jgi:hypothetical protein